MNSSSSTTRKSAIRAPDEKGNNMQLTLISAEEGVAADFGDDFLAELQSCQSVSGGLQKDLGREDYH